MIYLKNISDQNRKGQVTVDCVMTEHPISNTQEWLNLPTRIDGAVLTTVQLAAFKPENKSKEYRCIIKPGETAKFGEGKDLNEEHAEHIYQIYGSPEFADEYGRKNRNWLIEVNEKDEEIKDNLFEKYRSSYKSMVDFKNSNKE